jgi:hypothetical protein
MQSGGRLPPSAKTAVEAVNRKRTRPRRRARFMANISLGESLEILDFWVYWLKRVKVGVV